MTEDDLLQALYEAMQPQADSDGYTKRELMRLWGKREKCVTGWLQDMHAAGMIRAYKGPRENMFGEVRMTYLYAPIEKPAG